MTTDRTWEHAIKDALSHSGWDDTAIQTAFDALHRQYRRTPLPKVETPKKSFTNNRKTLEPVVLEKMTILWQDPVMSLQDIARALNLSLSTTRRLALDMGLPRRMPGRKRLNRSIAE